MKKIKKAILPVAGLGTRFLPMTKAQPKEMLPLVDKPVIQFLVEEAADAGIEEVIFVTGKGKRAIEDHFDSAPELENVLEIKGKKKVLKALRKIPNIVKVTYVRQKEARGPGDALLSASHLVGDEPVAVLFGDDIVVSSKRSCLRQMCDIYEETDASVLALERVKKSLVSEYGVVKARKIKDRLYNIQGIVEKPKPADAPSKLAVVGKYILTPEIWPYLGSAKERNGERGVTEALEAYVKSGNTLYGHEFEGERFDCGSKIGFLKATVHLGLRHEETRQDFKRYIRSLNL